MINYLVTYVFSTSKAESFEYMSESFDGLIRDINNDEFTERDDLIAVIVTPFNETGHDPSIELNLTPNKGFQISA